MVYVCVFCVCVCVCVRVIARKMSAPNSNHAPPHPQTGFTPLIRGDFATVPFFLKMLSIS